MSMPGAWPAEDDDQNIEMAKDGEGPSHSKSKTSPSRPGPVCCQDAFLVANTLTHGQARLTFAYDMASTENTPTGRPLAEPPVFNYNDFVR